MVPLRMLSQACKPRIPGGGRPRSWRWFSPGIGCRVTPENKPLKPFFSAAIYFYTTEFRELVLPDRDRDYFDLGWKELQVPLQLKLNPPGLKTDRVRPC